MSELVSSFMIFTVATKAATGAMPRITGGRLGEGLAVLLALTGQIRTPKKIYSAAFVI